MTKTKQPAPAKKSIAQQHREERVKDLRWVYIFRREPANPCVLCGRPFEAVGLQLTYGPHAYACEACVEELRPDLWKRLSEYRRRFVKPHLTDKELADRGAMVQDLVGVHLDELHRRYIDWQKATVSSRRGS